MVGGLYVCRIEQWRDCEEGRGCCRGVILLFGCCRGVILELREKMGILLLLSFVVISKFIFITSDSKEERLWSWPRFFFLISSFYIRPCSAMTELAGGGART